MRKGFTLVELSIVLVIIGLLIGGILVARSMIETAKIQNYIRSFQQFQIAINNFESNYKSIPGDSKLFDPPGCGFGYHGFRNTYNPNCSLPVDAYTPIENLLAFAHLSQAGMIKGSYRKMLSTESPNQTVGETAPTITQNPLWVSLNGSPSPKIPVFYYAAASALDSNIASEFTVFEAITLDTKMDDGNANTGNVVSNEDFYNYLGCDKDYLTQNAIDPNTYTMDTFCYVSWLFKR